MSQPDHPVAVTQYGPVRGVRKTAATGVEYLNFQRIPYCKPPIGERRFKVEQIADIYGRWTPLEKVYLIVCLITSFSEGFGAARAMDGAVGLHSAGPQWISVQQVAEQDRGQ